MVKKFSLLNNYAVIFPVLFINLFVFATDLKAQGNLLIMPRRVVFEGAKRTQELNLANTGRDTARYVISVIEYRMKEDGNFELITEPDSGQYFAARYFRFFPRTVVLAPNEAQVIKVQLTNTAELKPGEYRSHLYFRALPEEKPLGEKETIKDNSGITIKLTPVFGIAIPVIIRNDQSTTQTSLSDLSCQFEHNEQPVLRMTIKRTGNMSVYGDITVNYISTKGVTTVVGLVKGLSVYTPNQSRSFQLKLDANAKINYHTGKLQIVYSAQADSKPAKFAEQELLLK